MIRKEKEDRSDKNPKNKKSRLKKVWMKLVKIFHPDKHMSNEKDKKAYEEMMVTVNRAKKEGDLEILEEIAKEPEKFLKEAKIKIKSPEGNEMEESFDNPTQTVRDEKKELMIVLDGLLEDIRKIKFEEKSLKESPDLTLWEIWKNKPDEFENAMREMESNLLSEIETLEKVLSKLMKKLDEKSKSGGLTKGESSKDDDYTEITCKYIPLNPILIINKMNGDEIERVLGCQNYRSNQTT